LFKEAAKKVNELKQRPSDAELLEIYGLYKQAEVGDITGDRPSFLDPKGRAKYDAWTSRKGMSAEDAREKYIAEVEKLVEKYGTN